MDRQHAGFTLVEALITLATAGLTLTVALPTFSDALERNRTTATLHHLSADMAMARTSAIIQRRQVVVCPKASDQRCSDGADWSAGWLVFTDADGNRQPDSAADVLRITDAPGGGRLSLGASRAFLRYQVDGRSAHSNLTVHVCSAGLLRGQVVVNNHGRVRSARPKRETPCPQG